MHEIKCKECQKFSKNSDYCEHCGNLISHQKIREEEIRIQTEKEKRKEKEPSYIERMKNHSFWGIRMVGKIFHSVWITFMAIGAFIAWLIAAIAA